MNEPIPSRSYRVLAPVVVAALLAGCSSGPGDAGGETSEAAGDQATTASAQSQPARRPAASRPAAATVDVAELRDDQKPVDVVYYYLPG